MERPERSDLLSNQNGGQNGLRGFPASAGGVWTYHGAHSLSAPRSSLVAADLYLASVRLTPEISGTSAVPRLLAGEARGSTPLRAGCAFTADPARRAAFRGRRFSAALV